LVHQSQKLTLSSRAFYNDCFPRFAKFITHYFGFESVLPMNTGAEAVETALKLAKKWGYKKKKVAVNQAIIVNCHGCFHGRTIGVVSMSDDPDAYEGFQPLLPGYLRIPFNDVDALKKVLEQHSDRIVAFLVEPIQGEAGVMIPRDGYLSACAELCKKHNVLFIADEVQTGLSRTGKLLACDYDNVKPDILILGKALSGGLLPLSCVLTSREIMYCIRPGEHGSTFGGNPLASAVGIAALKVLQEENLAENAFVLGQRFRDSLKKMNIPYFKDIRGKGLLNAIEVDPKFKHTAWDICMVLLHNGILCKPTHDTIIRLAPPLTITQEQLDDALKIFQKVFELMPSLSQEDIPQEEREHLSEPISEEEQNEIPAIPEEPETHPHSISGL